MNQFPPNYRKNLMKPISKIPLLVPKSASEPIINLIKDVNRTSYKYPLIELFHKAKDKYMQSFRFSNVSPSCNLDSKNNYWCLNATKKTDDRFNLGMYYTENICFENLCQLQEKEILLEFQNINFETEKQNHTLPYIIKQNSNNENIFTIYFCKFTLKTGYSEIVGTSTLEVLGQIEKYFDIDFILAKFFEASSREKLGITQT